MCISILNLPSQVQLSANLFCPDKDCNNYRYGKLLVNPNFRTVMYDGKPVDLSTKEYFLLLLFLKYPEQIFSYEAIVEQLWDVEKTPTHSSVRFHIKSLRKAFKQAGATNDIITTIYGVGYRLSLAERENSKVGKLPPAEVLEQLLRLKSLEYVSINYEGAIVNFSLGASNYSDYPEAFYSGTKLGEAFPELLEYEQKLQQVLDRELDYFVLPEFVRESNPERPQYISLYAIAHSADSDRGQSEQTLFIFFEDVTELVNRRPK
ncbi:winged helix-turn-helix domain-containing protein [Oscillatoria sp. FACHB-1406]|uniref:winged helix-turn-helix domain-containing protein n=1 Tax=Oscillatoria sp. FACHB-1406 TaxID=2692846 RepID=UPI001687CC3C|nr:winged helix-turn-helix domain-containing protein [Oscillatoria sp. FACHB-1406]MBD2578052.1 response regulator transcription factor [Oscillatoria sp. FACHB-1406]